MTPEEKEAKKEAVLMSIYAPCQNDANIAALIQGKPIPFREPNTKPLPPGFKCGQIESEKKVI